MLNFDIKTAQEKRVLQLHELEEIRLDAFESSKIYKKRTKALHDQKIHNREFKAGDLVLLFNSRLKLFPGKLKTIWSGPFKILEVRAYGAIVLEGKDGQGLSMDRGSSTTWYLKRKRELHQFLFLIYNPLKKVLLSDLRFRKCSSCVNDN
ncbi:uncharacterized protein LOC112084507 [Eutrema salsugineum]|uniref:uncharacterized protein LOC112084507 n=1 Tax=Eutrema salsugineum TaxID=72664 RepID=UPI000CED4BA3|nr:uncharacterized protein LOC112084507 [Eutrema salsugineum]